MVVVEQYTSAQIDSFSKTVARLVYDTTNNALRFNNNSTTFSNIIASKDASNNLSNINNLLTTGKIGINTTTPGKQLEVNSSTGDCLRLTYNDADGGATYYSDFNVSAAGVLSITPSSGLINIPTHNGNDKGLQLGGTLVKCTADELNYLYTSTPGTAVAGKALVVNSSKNIIGINYLETTSASTIGVSTAGNTTVATLSLLTTPQTTAGIGLGSGLEFDLVNSGGDVFSAGLINCVSSVVTANSEKAYFEYKLINAGVMDTVFTISNTGVVTATSLVETSDARVKENICDVSSDQSLTKLMDVDVKSYNYTFDAEKKPRVGVIAQDIKKIFPEVVEVSSQHGLDDFHSVHYTGIVPHLINAVKHLQREIEDLKAKLDQ